MFGGVALSVSELPAELVEGLRPRVYDRGGEPEVRFLLPDRERMLPVWLDGQLQVIRWGNRRGESPALPLTAWTRAATLESGGWGDRQPVPVIIATTLGLDGGIWYRIREGVRGVVVHDEQARPVVYPLVEPSSHYYEVMTRSQWMPVMVGPRI
jgi:hypothetical protein